MIGTKQDTQVYYSALTFRNLLDALARPGKIKQLAYPDFLGELPSYYKQEAVAAVKINAYALGAMLTLLDRETSFVMAANNHWLEQIDPAMQWVVLRSGANIAAPNQAAFAFFCDQHSGELVTQLNVGTLLEPESSATAIYCIEQLAQSQEELGQRDDRLTLILRGPGIETTNTVSLLGLSEVHLKAPLADRRGYPLGIDIYLIDAVGHCIGLPRTTSINVISQEK